MSSYAVNISSNALDQLVQLRSRPVSVLETRGLPGFRRWAHLKRFLRECFTAVFRAIGEESKLKSFE
jgi:hypothetical protein